MPSTPTDHTTETRNQQVDHDEPHPTPAGPRLLDLSWPQVFGGALAAMTAAALGSRLGVAGTVIGSALASICAAVLGAVYTASIRRTHQTVRGALSRTVRVTGRANGGPPARTTLVESPDPEAAAAPELPRPRRFGRRTVITALVGAVAVFALSIGGVAAVELASGRSLDGQQGSTTVGRIVQGSSGGSDGSGSHSSGAGSSSPSAAPSATASSEPTSGSGGTAGAQPTAPSGSAGSATSSRPSSQASSGTSSEPSSQTSSGSASDTSSAEPSSAASTDAASTGSSGSGSSGN